MDLKEELSRLLEVKRNELQLKNDAALTTYFSELSRSDNHPDEEFKVQLIEDAKQRLDSTIGSIEKEYEAYGKRIKQELEAQMEYMHPEDSIDLECVMALSPLDGRYLDKVKDLHPFFSEYGLIRYRVIVEVKWLLTLSQIPEIKEVPSFSKNAESYLENIISSFSKYDALEVMKTEKKTNHDVTVVNSFLKKRCESNPEITQALEFFQFACTSDDISSLAHTMALKEAFNTLIFPTMIELLKAISKLAKENAHISMLSCTHGQRATPTSLGKEMADFAFRLGEVGKTFTDIQVQGKCADAVGTYSALNVAYPDINWPNIASEFVASLGIGVCTYMTQIQHRDYMVKLFDAVIQFNNILTDFVRDIRSYISLDYFKQVEAGEIGPSAVHHKVNPIDFEISEANLCLANGVLSAFSTKLPIYHTQNLGIGSGYSLVAYKTTLQGIRKLKANLACLAEEQEQVWEALAKPIETVLSRHKVAETYATLKRFTRETVVGKQHTKHFIDSLKLPEEAKVILLNATPQAYTAEIEKLAQSVDEHLDLANGFRLL